MNGKMDKKTIIDSLRDQAEDKRLLANDEPDSIFLEDAAALDAAVEMLENGCRETGKWVTSSDVPDTLICSVCHEWFDAWHYDDRVMYYCPRCGAKLKGGGGNK